MTSIYLLSNSKHKEAHSTKSSDNIQVRSVKQIMGKEVLQKLPIQCELSRRRRPQLQEEGVIRALLLLWFQCGQLRTGFLWRPFLSSPIPPRLISQLPEPS